MTQENNSPLGNNSNKDNFKNAICYIPFVAIWLLFSETNRSDDLNKNIKYGISLLIAFLLIRFVIEGILMIPISGLLFIIYIFISGIFGYKAYKGEKVDIKYIDDIEEKIKNNMK